MKRICIALIACLGVAGVVAAAQAQQYPLPPSGPPAACAKFTPKMSLAVGTFDRFRRTTSILAPISTRASGTVRVSLLGGGRITEFNLPIDSRRGRIRATRGIDAAQARAATAILTIDYPGDADTRPQSLRLRAALRAAKLSSRRPTITPAGELDVRGAITRRARGVVRVELEWVNGSDGSTGVFERQATIRKGRWAIRSQLPQGVRSLIANRCSTVQSYVLFTGYQPLLMRGELRSFQVLPSP